jgi:hypothetical protein
LNQLQLGDAEGDGQLTRVHEDDAGEKTNLQKLGHQRFYFRENYFLFYSETALRYFIVVL